MFKQVLAIAVIGAAALTSVAARASDWNTGARYAPATTARYVHYRPPVRYVAPRYYPAYRWAPAPSRWAPSYRHGHPAYGYHRYGYHSGHHNGRDDWNNRGGRRDWDRGDDDHRNNRRGR